MNRHPFRWDSLVFGLFFLAMIGQWSVWDRGLLDPSELAYINAAVLIALGGVGILLTAVGSRSDRRVAPFTPTTDRASAPDDTTDEGTTP